MTTVALPLSVRDLTDDDLRSVIWCSPLNLGAVADELRRATLGEMSGSAISPTTARPTPGTSRDRTA